MSSLPPAGGGGRTARLWRAFRRPSARWSVAAIFVGGGAAGVIFWGGFNTFMEYTNTLEFCVSCHEMKQLVYVEYKKTGHYTNRTGVRVICSDCHVPKEWTAKLVRKIQATNELWHWALGTIDTPEKFEARRPYLAERVWTSMKESDSHECRNCHSYQAMDFHKQTARAREKMETALEEKKTCIECHKGVAHKRPPEERDD